MMRRLTASLALSLLACGACPEPPPATPPAPADQLEEGAMGAGLRGGDARLAPTQTPAGMVRVPAGDFLRGSPDGVGLRDEHPQRKIFLDAFDIDRVEVSSGDYQKCVAAGACPAPACTEDGDEPEARPTYPVVCVAWEAAAKYCAWAGKRLPTEAEWEKAARGTEGARFPWGEGEPTCNLANSYDCGNERQPVDALPKGASPFGALNMAGNVFEWVADWHHADYYAISPEKNPAGPWSGEKKVVRGGAYSYGEDELSSHGRTYDRPVKAYDQVGFRCVSEPRVK